MTDQDKKAQPLAPKLKPLQIVPAPLMALLKLQFVGGGELPPELAGVYTSSQQAKEAALAYYATKGETVEVLTPLESKGKSETRKQINSAHRDIQPI